jgi:hypothetical protein
MNADERRSEEKSSCLHLRPSAFIRGRIMLLAVAPLLIVALAHAQPPPDPNGVNRDLLRHVEDDAPVRNAGDNRDEALAYDYLFNYAGKVPPNALQRAARHDLTFAHLFGEERYKYRGELVHVEGRLKRLRRFDPTPALEADGYNDLYEAWVFPEPIGGNPYCVVFGELPSGLKPGEDLDRWVSSDAYFFKLYRYQAADGWRRAPLLIGRAVVPAAGGAPAPASIWAVPGAVVPLTLGLVGAAIAVAAGVAWWFRREDRRARERLRQIRPEAPAELTLPAPDDD